MELEITARQARVLKKWNVSMGWIETKSMTGINGGNEYEGFSD